MCFCSKCCGLSTQPRGAWENSRQRQLKDLLKDESRQERGIPGGGARAQGKGLSQVLCAERGSRRAMAEQRGVCDRNKGRGWERCRGSM